MARESWIESFGRLNGNYSLSGWSDAEIADVAERLGAQGAQVRVYSVPAGGARYKRIDVEWPPAPRLAPEPRRPHVGDMRHPQSSYGSIGLDRDTLASIAPAPTPRGIRALLGRLWRALVGAAE